MPYQSRRAAKATIALAAGDPAAALDMAAQAVTGGMALGVLHAEEVRRAWPDAVEAALSLGRLDEVERLLAIVADRPLGHVPPYLRAQHARYRARLDAAQGHQQQVEAGFTTAEDILASSATPTGGRAGTRLDHAHWLLQQRQPDAAALFAEQAAEVFAQLGAAPALAQARRLVPAAAPTPL